MLEETSRICRQAAEEMTIQGQPGRSGADGWSLRWVSHSIQTYLRELYWYQKLLPKVGLVISHIQRAYETQLVLHPKWHHGVLGWSSTPPQSIASSSSALFVSYTATSGHYLRRFIYRYPEYDQGLTLSTREAHLIWSNPLGDSSVDPA